MTQPSISNWLQYNQLVEKAETIKTFGRVVQVIGLVVEGEGPVSAVGDICHIKIRNEEQAIVAEVVGFRDNKVLLMPLGELRGVEPGCQIIPRGSPARVRVSRGLLGRVLDKLGHPIDQKGPITYEKKHPLYDQPLNPLSKQKISEPIDVDIKAINELLTIGKDQRIAIFSESSIDKSTLLGMIARHTATPRDRWIFDHFCILPTLSHRRQFIGMGMEKFKVDRV